MRYNVLAILDFLKELKYNNSVEWMHAHQTEYKSWSLYQNVPEKDLYNEDFPERVIESFRLAKPWNDFINEALVESGVKLTW